MSAVNAKVYIRGLVLIASLVAIGFLFEATRLGTAFDRAWIDSEIRGQGMVGQMLFLAAAAVFTGFGLPRHVVGFLAGYAFGFVTGTVLTLVATLTGCVMAFHYARFLGRELVASRFPARIRGIDGFLRQNPFSMTLLIRLLPVGSNLAVNLAAGVSSVRPLPFLAGSAAGYIPQAVVFSLAGSGLTLEPGPRIGLSVVLFVVSGAIGIHLYRKHRHGKTFDEAVDRQLGGGRPTGEP